MNEQFLKQIDEKPARQIGAFEESFGDKLELRAEGQQLFTEKLKATRTEFKEDIAKADHRLTMVEARLSQRIHMTANRRDTEVHRVPGSGGLNTKEIKAHS